MCAVKAERCPPLRETYFYNLLGQLLSGFSVLFLAWFCWTVHVLKILETFVVMHVGTALQCTGGRAGAGQVSGDAYQPVWSDKAHAEGVCLLVDS